MLLNQRVRARAAHGLIFSAPALVALAAAFTGCGVEPGNVESQLLQEQRSQIKFLADPNLSLQFAGTQSFAGGTLTIGLSAGDTVVLARTASNGNITINGNATLGATATNTNVINVTYAAGTAQNLVLDYVNGAFGMGKKGTSNGTFVSAQGNVNDTLNIRMPDPTTVTNANVTFAETLADLTGDSVADLSFTATGPGYVPVIVVELGPGNDAFTGAGGQFNGGGGTPANPVGTTANTGSGALTALWVFGGAGNDNIICGKGNDILHGGAGNDSFNGGTGPGGEVSFYGDAGTDSLSFAARNANLTLALNGNAGSGQVGENITIGADIEILTGGSGDDTISGAPTPGLKTTLAGGPGNDYFVQTSVTADSNDTIVGGPGTDTIDYSARTCNTNVTLEGTANDGCGGEGDNVGADVENITTGSGADYVMGSASDNRINGGTGANYLNGGAGDDTFDQGTEALNTGADTIVGGTGEDTVDYTLRTAALVIDLTGTLASGESGENDKFDKTLEDAFGGAGADTLTGNVEDNIINGGAGTDTVTDCGGGADIAINCEVFDAAARADCGIQLP